MPVKQRGLSATQLAALCADWPGVSTELKWDSDQVLCVLGKMFAITPVDGSLDGRLSIKVPAERFLELTDQSGIVPAPYLARHGWVCVTNPQQFSTTRLEGFVRDSYGLVIGKLSKKLQATLAPPTTMGKASS